MLVTLIGYRGSGKSSVAVPLAKRLRWGVIDADSEIVRRAGQTIREIFADGGEPRFRRLEREVLGDLLQSDRLVVAAGGGAILNEQTRREMQDAGPVVWLRATVETLFARIGNDRSTADQRPNLTDERGTTEIERVLAEREPLYRDAAKITIDTDGRSIAEIVDAILPAIGLAVCERDRA